MAKAINLAAAQGLFEKFLDKGRRAPVGRFIPQRLPQWSALTTLDANEAGPFLVWLAQRHKAIRSWIAREHDAFDALLEYWLGNAEDIDQSHLATAIDSLPRNEDSTLNDGQIRGILRTLTKLAKKGPLASELSDRLKKLPKILFRNKYLKTHEQVRRTEWAEQFRLFAAAGKASAAPRKQHGAMAGLPTDDELWDQLLFAAAKETGARPSASFVRRAEDLLHDLGKEKLTARSYALFDAYITDPNPTARRRGAIRGGVDLGGEAMRGVVWTLGVARIDSPEHCRRLAALTLAALKVVDWGRLRAPKLANGCIRALARIGTGDSVSQLAWLKTRVKQKTIQNEIAKAMSQCAAAAGMTVADLEEVGTPRFGFDADGVRRETLPGYVLTLRIDDAAGVAKSWAKADDKPLKSPPMAATREHAAAIKELTAAAKDAERMLTSQRRRLDTPFVEDRNWSLATFRDRYLAHPLLRPLATRLIWTVGGTPAVFVDGKLHDVDRRPVAASNDATVALWHPIDATPEQVLAWRARLAELGVTQPFKQAHREVYLLTDAERRTAEYSNRFAAHLIRQSQFRTLAGHRNWQTQLIGPWDGGDHTIAKRLLPGGLRAEFWLGAAKHRQSGLHGRQWLALSRDRPGPFLRR